MMVSSKFSRSNHAFRTPDVCRKQISAPGPPIIPDPCPKPECYNSYDIDVTGYGNHWVFSGVMMIQYRSLNMWWNPEFWPYNGPACIFRCGCAFGIYSASIVYWKNGVNVFTTNSAWYYFPPNPNFDTGTFTYASYGYSGTQDGRVYNQ